MELNSVGHRFDLKRPKSLGMRRSQCSVSLFSLYILLRATLSTSDSFHGYRPRDIPVSPGTSFYVVSHMVATLLAIFSSFSSEMAANSERSFIMVKPDGVQRGLVGEIMKRFEQRGYKLVACKQMQSSKEHLEKHYADLSSKGFFKGLVTYMASGPVVAMVWEGKDVVKTGRKMLGATNPLESNPGTIRGDYCIDVGRNICHGSDSVESAKREIDLWFKPDEIMNYAACEAPWLYE